MTTQQLGFEFNPFKIDKHPNGKFICVNCGYFGYKSLYDNFGHDVGLIHCKQCSNIIDKYIEYDSLLIIIDLLLHRQSVYRHLIFNRFTCFNSKYYYYLIFWMLFISSLFEMIAFNLYYENLYFDYGYFHIFQYVLLMKTIRFGTIILISMCLSNDANIDSLFLALTLSSIGWIFILFIVIFNYHKIFINTILIFVLIQNIVAINVINNNLLKSMIATIIGWIAFISYGLR